MEIPQAPLGTLYGQRLVDWFAAHQVVLRLGQPIRRLDDTGTLALSCDDGTAIETDYAVLAVPWNRVVDLLSPELAAHCPWAQGIRHIESAPITGVHLWFDRPITALPHAVLVGRLSQWLFNRGNRDATDQGRGHYYQVVISASRSLAGRDRQQIVAEVLRRAIGHLARGGQRRTPASPRGDRAGGRFLGAAGLREVAARAANQDRALSRRRRLDRHRLAGHDGGRRAQRLFGCRGDSAVGRPTAKAFAAGFAARMVGAIAYTFIRPRGFA